MIPTGRIKHNILITLLEARCDRVMNYHDMIETYSEGRVSSIRALDANKHWPLIEFMFKHFNIPVSHGYVGRGKGKLARWATILMTAKYFIDNNINHTITVLEDDVYVPDDTDWRHDEWKDAKSWVKLSTWGEIIGMNKPGAVNFIEQAFQRGIYDNDDNFVMNHVKLHKCQKLKDCDYNLINNTNAGHIKSCGNIIHRAPFFLVPLDHKGNLDKYTHHDDKIRSKMEKWVKVRGAADAKLFMSERLFKNQGDRDIPKVLNRIYVPEKN